MNTIRDKASDILGVYIEKGHWDEAFKRLDISGRVTQKQIIQLLLMICKHLDEQTDKSK